MLSTITPASGRLLISEPFMNDPNFKRAVILLAEHSEEGTLGYVLNQPSEYKLSDVLPDVAYSELPVYVGGPVANNTLHFIHRCPDKIEGGAEIWDGIYWGGSFEQVKELVNSYQLNESEIRFFAGYSGWTPGQLDEEITGDTWIVANKFDPDMVFSSDEHNLWREVVINLGQRYAHIANFPENPMLN
ncbi:YqgE/AlgH family protein [Mucilaginibacter daejeonensis]|uniref:YqgE/AlgH family protein n=1 Tax=Mucilaginibacter daejeonensis TaxID=398049 RepID=UPI001D17D201|nr:YqgE/AlgH family protein [Mucilaginibacter daejeonensis]UEG51717.1 YqgE/AlgH family protein [Mucilaginibacter daejeonensis]